MTGICDSFQRPINYLRISVTDRCNLRCFYCRPENLSPWLPREEVLSYEEIVTVVRACVELGITRIRLTGGEPLIRSDLPILISKIAQVEGIEDISLTTNGILLSRYARRLKEAGLRRVNISLDSLQKERFARITGKDGLKSVIKGIETARKVGLNPVKVNMVVLRGVNDDEVIDFARLTVEAGWNVRFIELMPFGSAGNSFFVSMDEVRERLTRFFGPLEPYYSERGWGPAKYFRIPGSSGSIGFITPVSQHFCFGCNRLRLTAGGSLRLCLLRDDEVALKELLRRGASDKEVRDILRRAISLKPQGHSLGRETGVLDRNMNRIGG